MNILALDLGTNTGVAYGPTDSSHWDLTSLRPDADDEHVRRRQDPRVSNLVDRLAFARLRLRPDILVFEDVKFGVSLAQVQLWSSFRGALWAFARLHRMKCECLPVDQLKIYATGSAGANKAAMAKAFVRKHPGSFTLQKGLVKQTATGILLSDDQVDALHLWSWAYQTLK